MLGAVPSTLRLPAGGQTDAAGDGGAQVGEDVAEEVVGDDDVRSVPGRSPGTSTRRRRAGRRSRRPGGSACTASKVRCHSRPRRSPGRWSCAPGRQVAAPAAGEREGVAGPRSSTPCRVLRLSSTATSCGRPRAAGTPPSPGVRPLGPQLVGRRRSRPGAGPPSGPRSGAHDAGQQPHRTQVHRRGPVSKRQLAAAAARSSTPAGTEGVSDGAEQAPPSWDRSSSSTPVRQGLAGAAPDGGAELHVGGLHTSSTAARSTRTACSTTSGPIPSPPTTATRTCPDVTVGRMTRLLGLLRRDEDD